MPEQGYATQLAIGASGTAIGSFTDRLEFISFDPGEENTLIDTSEQAIRGTRSRSETRVALGLVNIAPTLVLNPSPNELDLILPWIGFTESPADTFSLIESPPIRDILYDAVQARHVIRGAKVNRARFRSSPGQPLQLTLECLAQTSDTPSATAFPSISIQTDRCYMHHEGVLTLEGGAREVTDVECVIDNILAAIFNNSRTASDIDAQDRLVTLSANTPYDADHDELYDNAKAASTGATGSLVYTNGGLSTTFTFGNLKNIARPPNISGKSEIRLANNYRAYETSAGTKELVITHDATE